MLTVPGGFPVAVQTYSGKTTDPNTVTGQVVKLREYFGLDRGVLIGDRGPLTQVRTEQIKRHPAFGGRSALRVVQARALVESEALQLPFFDEQNLAEFVSP